MHALRSSGMLSLVQTNTRLTHPQFPTYIYFFQESFFALMYL
jgi:hypothetical protein